MEIPTIEEIITQDIESFRSCPHKLDCGNCPDTICVKIVSVADFPSEYGHFRIIGVVNNKDRKDHTIIARGDISDGENVLTRIHSACLTGEALGSRRCDCGPQLREALSIIEKEGRGIVLYHMEEGRGIGLVNKLRAYSLQDAGFDTYDANVLLGFKADERSYEIPAAMMKRIGIKSVRLMTNNPEKVAALEKYGIRVAERVHHELPAHHHDRRYMETKKERFGHMLGLDHDAESRN